MRDQILKALSDRASGEMTYVIANVVGFRGNAAPVRRELVRMMRDGLVEHAPHNVYARQLKWRLKHPAHQAQAQETS